MHYDYVCLLSACAHLNPAQPLLTQRIMRYAHGEVEVSLDQRLDGVSVLLLASMAGGGLSANDHLVETLVTLRALRPAKHITLGVMYGAYARQADGGQWMYDQFRDADDIWILDPHTPPPAPIQVRTAALMFAEEIRARFPTLPVIVSPDAGGAARAQKVAEALGAELCVLGKLRANHAVVIESAYGAAVKGRACVVVDDIIDSGQTLMAAHDYLMQQGASEVHVCATHGLMHGETAKKLGEMFGSLCVSDSVVYEPGVVGDWAALSSSSLLGQSQLLGLEDPSL